MQRQMVSRVAAVAAGVVLTLGAAAATAQSDRLGSKTIDELVACRTVKADAERLACFDRASGRIATARASGDLLALDREKVVENKRRGFGLAGGADQPLGGGVADRATTVTEVTSPITIVRPSPTYGRYLIQLANNMVWETIDPLMLSPSKGDAVTIKKAGFGGFRGSIAKGRPILMKRIR